MPRVVFAEVEDATGFYDHETGVIYVDKRCDRRTKASTIVHEEVHAVFGHCTAVVPAPVEVHREVAVDRVAARIRIPFGALVEALTRHDTLEAQCRFLGCDREELMARVFGLTRAEQFLFEVCARKCVGLSSAQARRGYPFPIGSRTMALC